MKPRPVGLAAGLLMSLGTHSAAADTVLTLSTEAETLDLPASAISDMDVSESGGITDVFLRLMPGATEELSRLTATAIGQAMTLSFCEVDLMSPVVRARIDSGTIYLAGTTMVRAEALRAVWHGRASCDTLPPEVFEHGQ